MSRYSTTGSSYPLWTLALPEPVPFPRDLFARALEEHALLFEQHLEALTSDLHLQMDDGVLQPRELVGVILIGPRPAPDDAQFLLRASAVRLCRNHRGLVRPLLERPAHPRVHVVILAAGAVSLHVARIEDVGKTSRRMVMESPGLVVEPVQQGERVSADGAFVVTRWEHPDGKCRYAWRPIPTPPASEEEAVDRVVARDEPRIRALLWSFLREGRDRRPLAKVMCTPEDGDMFEVYDRATDPLLRVGFPRIGRAIDEQSGSGFLPVVVVIGRRAGLRWLEVVREPRSAKPEAIDEPLHFPLRAVTAAPSAPEEPPRQRTEEEAFDDLVQDGIDDEIDSFLCKMSHEELERAVAHVGLDPAVELADGWLRERAIRKISMRRYEEAHPDEV